MDDAFASRLAALMAERGLGVLALARQVPCDKALVSRLANGRQRPSARTACRLDDVLGAGGELAALAAAARAPALRPSPSSDRQEGDEVLRREFIGASAGLAAAVLPQIAQLPPGRRVGEDLVDQLAGRTARLRGLDDYLGGAGTYRLYTAELETTLRVLKQARYTEDTGCALLSVAAEQAQQAGWAAFDAGWGRDASRLYDMSLAAASQAGNAPLAANALILRAYQQVSTGQRGLQAATAACRLAGADGTPGAAQALTLERAAWAHAAARQAYECDQALNKAAVSLASTGAPAPGWAAWADGTELQIITGRCWVALGRPRQAAGVLEDALAGFADTHARDKALYLTWLAEAYLDAGEIEQAAVTTGRALALADGSGSVRPGLRCTGLLRRLTPHRSLPAVASLLDSTAGGLRPQAGRAGRATPGSAATRPRSGPR
jgi:transcriptional regulator with XRE-family HTH domain